MNKRTAGVNNNSIVSDNGGEGQSNNGGITKGGGSGDLELYFFRYGEPGTLTRD